MANQLIRTPRLRFFDTNDKPLIGGRLYLYDHLGGSLVATFQDYEQTIKNSNPIILDSAGYSSPIFGNSFYAFSVYSSSGELITNGTSVTNTVGLVAIESLPTQFWDANGDPLSFGKVYVCLPGVASLRQLRTDVVTGTYATVIDSTGQKVINSQGKKVLAPIVPETSTLVLTNTSDQIVDSIGRLVAITIGFSIPLENPVILDEDGIGPISLPSGESCKLFVFDQNDVPIFEQDDVTTF